MDNVRILLLTFCCATFLWQTDVVSGGEEMAEEKRSMDYRFWDKKNSKSDEKRRVDMFGKRRVDMFGKRRVDMFGKRRVDQLGKRRIEMFGKRRTHSMIGPNIFKKADEPNKRRTHKMFGMFDDKRDIYDGNRRDKRTLGNNYYWEKRGDNTKGLYGKKDSGSESLEDEEDGSDPKTAAGAADNSESEDRKKMSKNKWMFGKRARNNWIFGDKKGYVHDPKYDSIEDIDWFKRRESHKSKFAPIDDNEEVEARVDESKSKSKLQKSNNGSAAAAIIEKSKSDHNDNQSSVKDERDNAETR